MICIPACYEGITWHMWEALLQIALASHHPNVLFCVYSLHESCSQPVTVGFLGRMTVAAGKLAVETDGELVASERKPRLLIQLLKPKLATRGLQFMGFINCTCQCFIFHLPIFDPERILSVHAAGVSCQVEVNTLAGQTECNTFPVHLF